MLKNGIIILIAIKFLAADYYISFDFMSNNFSLISFHFNCSKAMTLSNKKGKFVFSIKTSYKDISLICRKQKKQIINNLLKYKFHIFSLDNKKLNNSFFKTKGVFLPMRFDIIIRNKKAYFYVKEND